MKLIIEKTCRSVIDTSRERARIKKAFRNEKTIRDKLSFLIDVIEARDWERAGKIIEGRWWQGYDHKAGCPRCEYIGLLYNFDCKEDSPAFSHSASYIDLVWFMLNKPKDYSVVKIT